jgi:K+-transporting ATPase ATPase C chain
MKTIRAHLLLLGLTLVLCSVVYPLVILVIGWVVFPWKASGSLIADEKGNIIGSGLVAQNFSGDQWFWPRPSACNYDASAAGASNWGPNNPRLRYRAVEVLGATARYRPRTHKATVQEDIEKWYKQRSDPLGEWLKAYPTVATAWLEDSSNKKAFEDWQTKHPGDLATTFYKHFAKAHPGAFPDIQDDKVQAVKSGPAIHKAFFELWLRLNPEQARDIEHLISDAVTASGSGLDPHITLRHARQQLPRVTKEWAKQPRMSREAVIEKVEKILKDNAFTPMGGEPIVNVLEINLALKKALSKKRSQ